MLRTLEQQVLLATLALAAALVVAQPLSAAPQQSRSRQNARVSRALTAFRPGHGSGYAPFERTPVAEGLEEDPVFGPGIRVNGAGEVDPAGEDDLLELVVRAPLRGAGVVLVRGGPELELWSTRDKQAGTQVPFVSNRTAALDLGGAARITLWVEWPGAAPALCTLELRGDAGDVTLDRLVFHAFTSLVVALGGESQTPTIPLDPTHGTFMVAKDLYGRGWDVLMRDEDQVSASGNGLVYDEVVNAIQKRSVGSLAIFGYSHGGGSTFHLAERLDTLRASIGIFAIELTSYVDGVQNDSDIDTDKELRRPFSSAFHVNHYQNGTFADFLLDGGPVPMSWPVPSGLDVETTPWGAGTTHFLIDDFFQVRDSILFQLESRLSR